MGENLVAGILKNIEIMSNINLNHNIAIITSINKTNATPAPWPDRLSPIAAQANRVATIERNKPVR